MVVGVRDRCRESKEIGVGRHRNGETCSGRPFEDVGVSRNFEVVITLGSHLRGYGYLRGDLRGYEVHTCGDPTTDTAVVDRRRRRKRFDTRGYSLSKVLRLRLTSTRMSPI